jgi:hypothetical protein
MLLTLLKTRADTSVWTKIDFEFVKCTAPHASGPTIFHASRKHQAASIECKAFLTRGPVGVIYAPIFR